MNECVKVKIEITCIHTRHLNARELIEVVIWLCEQLVDFKCFICTPKVRSFIILLTTDLLELINHDVLKFNAFKSNHRHARSTRHAQHTTRNSTGLWHTWTCTVHYTVSSDEGEAHWVQVPALHLAYELFLLSKHTEDLSVASKAPQYFPDSVALGNVVQKMNNTIFALIIIILYQ